METFDLFTHFPLEVRLMVWEEVCHTERIIPLLPGLGHLFPMTHPTLAVPPMLHACSESRRVGLKHYDLSFHANIYINRQYDYLMLHLFFPHQRIHFSLYSKSEAGFNWEAAPPRLAVLLDDISFHQSDEDERNKAWRVDPTWHQRLKHFSLDFLWSLLDPPHVELEEITLLVLPPLTVRPNCTAHQFSFVDDVADLAEMSGFFASQLRERALGVMDWPGKTNDGDRPPALRVRHAICSPWDASAVSWSTTLREACSAIQYADVEFGTPPEEHLPPGLPPGTQLFCPGPRDPFCTACRRERIRGIRMDLRHLREPFSAGVGLGSHMLWEEERYICASSMMNSGIIYRAKKQVLWLEDYKLQLPEIESSKILTDFDFGRFLTDVSFPGPPTSFDNWQKDDEELCRHEEDEAAEEDPWEMESLRCNGLFYW